MAGTNRKEPRTTLKNTRSEGRESSLRTEMHDAHSTSLNAQLGKEASQLAV